MGIDHIAMYVQDLEQVRDFFQTYFHAVPNEGYHNPDTGLRTYFLSFTGGCRLEIMTRPGMTDSLKAVAQMGYTHLALSVGSREEVNRITKQLEDHGYEVLSGPRTTGDGYYESCVLGPENNQIEITE